MKIFFDTVGCRLNQAEIEHMASQFRAAGHLVVESADKADIVIVNTCAVTAAAASDSRQKIRQANHADAKQIIVTGCWATLEPRQAAALPGISQVFSNTEKMDIPLQVLGTEASLMDCEPIARKPLPGIHQRTRAFIKAQDGCDNLCTYCVTRIARGASKSVPKEQILQDVLSAEKGGVHEIVLSGVHLGSWGREKNEGETIIDLIHFLLSNSEVERIRLSSIEPWDLDERFFELWQNPRMCRHLHLPLQSGSAAVLKRMVRHTTPVKYLELVNLARRYIPGVAITTDLIAGFPGETDEEFNENLQFIEEVKFSGGHVFKFSAREGTAAARMTGKVHGDIAHDRAEKMRVAIMRSEKTFLNSLLEQKAKVLWESSIEPVANGWRLHGFSDNYIRVEADSKDNRCNKIDTVLINEIVEDGLRGSILHRNPTE